MRLSVLIERDAGGWYVATVPGLPGCHTQARTIDELMVRVKEAAELYLEVEKPAVEERQLLGVQFIEVRTD